MPSPHCTEPASDTSLLADHLPLGVCLIDREFRVKLWNNTLAGWTGQKSSEVVGLSLLELFPNLNQAGYREPIERVFCHGEPVQFDDEQHCHFIPAHPLGGDPRCSPLSESTAGQLMVQRTTVQRHPTEPELFMLLIVDRTVEHRHAVARRQQQKHMEALSRQVASANWEHTEFIAKLSHELRQPLGTVFGYAEFLREQETAPDRRAAIEGLRRNGEKLVTVINDALDFTKIAAQQVRIERMRFELKPMLRDLVSLLSLTAAENGNQFTFECETIVPSCLVSDPTRLRQILLNLLTNAVTFTEGGKVRLEVSLHSADGGHEIAFAVSDTGIGIEPHLMPQLFEPFRQQDSRPTSSRNRGTRLGLAISSRLAGLLGGTLTATSEVHQGSTFTLRLPVAQ